MNATLFGSASLFASALVSIVEAMAATSTPMSALTAAPDPAPVLAMGLLLVGIGALVRKH